MKIHSLRGRMVRILGPVLAALLVLALTSLGILLDVLAKIDHSLAVQSLQQKAELLAGGAGKLYALHASAIINHNGDETESDWDGQIAALTKAVTALQAQLADPDDQGKMKIAATNLSAMNDLYKQTVLPLLAETDQMTKPIRRADATMFTSVTTFTSLAEQLAGSLTDQLNQAQTERTTSLTLLVWLTTAFALGSVLTFVFVVIFVLRVTVAPLVKASVFAERLAAGHLEERFAGRFLTRETASLQANLNLIAEKFGQNVALFTRELEVLTTSGTQLDGQLAETRRAADAIAASLTQLRDAAAAQIRGVEETSTGIHQISKNIDSFLGLVEQQTRSVNQSSAAVEEMVGNVASIGKNADILGEQFRRLETSAGQGRGVITQVSQSADHVAEQSRALANANKLVASIASQTGLLAMNAAIEAAHAGDAGRGFAVVADEIRKLADSASVQSKTIRQELRAVTEGVNAVVSFSGQADQAFSEIAAEIESLAQVLAAVQDSLAEQDQGNRQVLEALGELSHIGSEVKAGSQEMSAGTAHIAAQVQTVEGLSQTVETGFVRIEGAVAGIHDAVVAAEDLSTQNTRAALTAREAFSRG